MAMPTLSSDESSHAGPNLYFAAGVSRDKAHGRFENFDGFGNSHSSKQNQPDSEVLLVLSNTAAEHQRIDVMPFF